MTKKNEIATKPKNEIATIDFGADAGAGIGKISASETVIPYLNLLQALSPEANEGTDRTIEGAKAGLMLNTATRDLLEEAIIVPLLKQHFFVEWTPRDEGGGLVERHLPDSDFVRQVRETNNRDAKNMLLTPDGNHLVETFYLTALLLDDADAVDGDVVCISFARTKMGPWREMMQPIYKTATKYPFFAHRLRLTTKQQKDKQGRPYFNYVATPVNQVEGGRALDSVKASLIQDEAQYAFAKEAFEFVNQGLEDGSVKHADEDTEDDTPKGNTPF